MIGKIYNEAFSCQPMSGHTAVAWSIRLPEAFPTGRRFSCV